MLIRTKWRYAVITILRINRVQAGGSAKLCVDIIAGTLEVHAQQQRMINLAGGKFRLRLGIDRQLVEFLF